LKGGSKVVVEPHRHAGVFVAKDKEDALCTSNMVLGESVYGEKRINVQNEDGTKTEYRVWNPFRSKLAAAVLGGVDNIWIAPGSRANCIDSTVTAESVFAQVVKMLQGKQFKPAEQVTLEPFERDHACVVGGYRIPKK
ncbi:hypothetical protein Taro_055833, partial [Colocasia esculenta]|nr:hypothetical protein [Colocasia esculenta]